MLIAAATDPRISAIVSMIPVIDGERNMRRVHGTMGYRRLREAILRDRAARFENPADRGYLPHSSANPETELSAWPFPETYSTFTALQETEAPRYQNSSTIESVDLLHHYDVVPFARRILDTPTMMIVAEGDDLTLWDLEINAFNQIPAASKTLVTLPHTSHVTLYSDRSRLEVAAEASSSWFVEHLLGSGRGLHPVDDRRVRVPFDRPVSRDQLYSGVHRRALRCDHDVRQYRRC